MRTQLLVLGLLTLPLHALSQGRDAKDAVATLTEGYVVSARIELIIEYSLAHSPAALRATQAEFSDRTVQEYAAAAFEGYEMAKERFENIDAQIFVKATIFGKTSVRPWALTPFSLKLRNLETNEVRSTCRYLVSYLDHGVWYIESTRNGRLSDVFLTVFPDMSGIKIGEPPHCEDPIS